MLLGRTLTFIVISQCYYSFFYDDDETLFSSSSLLAHQLPGHMARKSSMCGRTAAREPQQTPVGPRTNVRKRRQTICHGGWHKRKKMVVVGSPAR